MVTTTLTALRHAQHAQQWAPVGVSAARMAARHIHQPRPMVAPAPPYSERRIIVDQQGRVIRRGDEMPPVPAVAVMSEDDLRIPTYMRRAKDLEKPTGNVI